MKRVLSLILTISVCCMSFVSVLGVSATIDTSKRLSVSTNTTGPRYIVDGNGNPVNLFGMARCQYHASEENVLFGNSVNDLVSHYRKFGINYMRLAIDINDIVGATVSDSLSLTTDEAIDNYISTNIDPDVQAIISAGIYVGLDIHMYAPSNKNTPDEIIAYANNNYLPVLKRLAYIYKDEPMIANIEIWNEPNVGANSDANVNTALRNFYISAVQQLHAIDTTRIIMVSDSNSGWGYQIGVTWDGYID